MKILRFIALILILASVTFAGDGKRKVGTLSAFYYSVVPLVIVGEGWTQQIVITCVDDSFACVGSLSFWGRDGKPWEVDLAGQTKASEYAYSLSSGQTKIFETVVKTHSQILGWAHAQDSIEGIGDILVQSIWRKETPDRPDLMTSVIASLPSFSPAKTSIFFDSRGGKYAGVMILFSDHCIFGCDSLQPVTFRGRAYDAEGNLITERQFKLKMGELDWFCLECDMPEVIGKTGTFVVEPVEFDSSTGAPVLCTFSLQFAPNGAFTAISGFEH